MATIVKAIYDRKLDREKQNEGRMKELMNIKEIEDIVYDVFACRLGPYEWADAEIEFKKRLKDLKKKEK